MEKIHGNESWFDASNSTFRHLDHLFDSQKESVRLTKNLVYPQTSVLHVFIGSDPVVVTSLRNVPNLVR